MSRHIIDRRPAAADPGADRTQRVPAFLRIEHARVAGNRLSPLFRQARNGAQAGLAQFLRIARGRTA